jgi:hypothetical protein
MLNAMGLDCQLYAPSLSSHWPSCMQEAAMWPILDMPPSERGEWHVQSRHIAEAYALAASVPAIRHVFEAAGVKHWGIKVGPASAFAGPTAKPNPWLEQRMSALRQPPPKPIAPAAASSAPGAPFNIFAQPRHVAPPQRLVSMPQPQHNRGNCDAEQRRRPMDRQRTRSPRGSLASAATRETATPNNPCKSQDPQRTKDDMGPTAEDHEAAVQAAGAVEMMAAAVGWGSNHQSGWAQATSEAAHDAMNLEAVETDNLAGENIAGEGGTAGEPWNQAVIETSQAVRFEVVGHGSCEGEGECAGEGEHAGEEEGACEAGSGSLYERGGVWAGELASYDVAAQHEEWLRAEVPELAEDYNALPRLNFDAFLDTSAWALPELHVEPLRRDGMCAAEDSAAASGRRCDEWAL